MRYHAVRVPPPTVHSTTDLANEGRLTDCLSDSVEEERARIGADLHDGLGQELTGLALLLHGLAQRAQRDTPGLALEIVRLSRMANASVVSIRDIAHGLLPIGLQRGDFRNALRALARSTRRTFGVRVTTRFRGEPTDYLAGRVAQHLYRIIQEAIGNAVKHGRAQKVSLTVQSRASSVTITVLDDGLGFDARRPSRGMGLRTMQHRADIIGGLLEVQHARGRGTRVLCVVPSSDRQ
jgi:signal transduction histidine kinase